MVNLRFHRRQTGKNKPGRFLLFPAITGILPAIFISNSVADEVERMGRYQRDVLPVLEQYCYACHGEGGAEGGMSLDGFASDSDLLNSHDQWWAVLKNLRAGVMPPAGEPRPAEDEISRIAEWIKADVFEIDLAEPDPGRSTIRRLNRTEYRNTIRDLMGVDFETEVEFPPDDTGFGFDNIGDVLSISPLLMEKYLQAAETIVKGAVPTVSKITPEMVISGDEFTRDDGGERTDRLTFYEPANIRQVFSAGASGSYRLIVEVRVDGEFDFDPGRCTVTFEIDGQKRFQEEYGWSDGKRYAYEFAEDFCAGDHKLSFQLQPLVSEDERKNSLNFEINAVRIQGPLGEEHQVAPDNYGRFFTRKAPPESAAARRDYAGELLSDFAMRAFRRPVNEETLNRLVSLAETRYSLPNATFEEGIAAAMTAVLTSPRFLFRLEASEPPRPDEKFSRVDEFALASRLSYFFWSTMPDEELFRLAERGQLRENLNEQVRRLMTDPRSEALVKNFTGQWLQARDVEHVSLDPIAALGYQEEYENIREEFFRRFRRRRGNQANADENSPDVERIRSRFRELRELADMMDGDLRRAMRRETEMHFFHILREDRSILELIDCNYAFLNGTLAEHYGIDGVVGRRMRKVALPPESHLGGVLTQGTFLTVTSNPTRTSPVKRGVFILENILGTPPPPPPAEVPELEEAKKEISGRQPSLREVLELHREKPLCSSCHARFDPLGLALENFNALGMWRDKDNAQPINAAGTLISGESFSDVRDLKQILCNEHREDFYRCLTERLLIYALGRGLDYHDVHTVDQIVADLHRHDGKFSALLLGIINSAPFQKRRIAESDKGGQVVSSRE